jgi:hypothetical protein
MESGPALILRTLDRHLTAPGRIRLFGGAALVLGYGRRRQTEDADLLLDDAECRALIDDSGFSEAVEATNAELNPRGLYLTHIFGPEQEILSPAWREQCRTVSLEGLKKLELSVLGPVDLVLTKLARGDEGDLDDVRFLLETGQADRSALRGALDQALVPEVLAESFAASRPKLLALLDEPG